MDDIELIAVAAVAENGVIGKHGEIPWPSVPADRRQYRSRVANDIVILGRRTYESMVDNPAGRVQIVLSRSVDDYDSDCVFVVETLEAAVACTRNLGVSRAYVLGGGKIYALSMPYLDQLLISRIPGTYEGDTWFPSIDPSVWELTATTPNDGFILERWVRRSPQ